MGLTLRQQIGQSMIIGLRSTELASDEKNFLTQNNIGGVILFARNFKTPEQLYKLVADVHSLQKQTATEAPFFVSIDMEGGRVQRLREPFTVWPPAKKLGDLDSPSMAFKFSEMMGLELKAVGINMNYAPVVDTLTNPKNQAIGDRAFGTDPELVARMSSAVIRGFIKSDIIPVAKHFPGHGNTLLDSHFDLPVEDADVERLKSIEMAPFKKAFRARLSVLMTSHIVYKKLDPEWPATLSKVIIQDILRKELGYRGVVITDDLGMKAMTDHFGAEVIPVQALNAGINILLYCNEPEAPVFALDILEKAVRDGKIAIDTIAKNYEMVLKLKKDHLSDFKMPEWSTSKSWIGSSEHKLFASYIESGTIPEGLST
jgi:beta-N-acetylhexosaminidase